MASGFIKNRTTPTITKTGGFSSAIEIGKTQSGDDGHDARSRPLPGSGSLSHVDFIFSGADSGSVLKFDLRLTYDSAGRDPVLPPLAAQTTKNGRVSPNVKMQVIDMGVRFFFTAPSTQTTAGSIYAFVNASSLTGDSDNQVVVDTIRVHWNDKV